MVMASRFLLFILLLMSSSGFSRAQSAAQAVVISELPICALTCLATALEASPCNTTETECQCADETLLASTELCVKGTCTIEESLVAKNATQTMCGARVRDKTFESNIITYILMGASCLVVFIRLFYKQFFTASRLGLDDWFILATLISAVPSAVINVVYLTGNGLGRDIWTLTPATITEFAVGFYINAILYFNVVAVLKLSILFFYLRIFPGRTIRYLLLATVVFDVLFGIAFVLAAAFQCTPVSYNWTNWTGEGGGTCVNINALAWANAAISIALDLWMLAIPLAQLRGLNLHWKKKIGVGLMFFVGTFVTVVSAIRLTSLVEFHQSENLTWDYWSVSIWSSVEITVGMICACMPSMRLILVRIFPRVLGGTSQHTPGQYYQKQGSQQSTRDRVLSGRSRSNGGFKANSSLQVKVSTGWHVISNPSDELVDAERNHFSKSSSYRGDFTSDTGQLVPMKTFQRQS